MPTDTVNGEALPRMIHKGTHLNVAGMTNIHILTVSLFLSNVDLHTETLVAIGTIMKHADMITIMLKVLGCHRNAAKAYSLDRSSRSNRGRGDRSSEGYSTQRLCHRSASPGHVCFQSPSCGHQRQGNYQ